MTSELPVHQRLLLNALAEPSTALACSNSDWEQLLGMARQTRLLSHLASKLQEAGLLAALPVRVQSQLHSSLMETRILRQRMDWELNRIAWALADHAIPVIVLKGAAYSLAGLPMADSRYCADLDILVPKDQLDVFESVLLAKGWLHPPMTSYDEHYYRAWSHELPALVHRDRRTAIDVHHNLAPVTSRLQVDTRLLFEDAVATRLPGYRILSPVDMVLHCAINLFQNNDLADDLRDLLDLDTMVRHFSANDPDFWSGLIARTNRLRLGRVLYYGLQFSRLICATPAPDGVEDSLQHQPARLSCRLMRSMVPSALLPLQPGHPAAWPRLARFILYVRSHWIRMPPHLLLVHVAYKSFARTRFMDDSQDRDVTADFFRGMVQSALASRPAVIPPGAGSVDWREIFKLAEAHGLLSLLGTRLPLLRDFRAPADFSVAAEQYAQANKLRNRMLLQEYRDLCADFHGSGIQLVALKGIAAIQHSSDYAAVRELADIDILIDAEQIAAARALLKRRGYAEAYAPNTVPAGAAELSPAQAQVYERVYHEFSFVSADGLIYVDVHWRLSPSVYPTGIPSHLKIAEIARDGTLLPAYELVYVCAHAAKDGWSELKWAIDIAWLTRNMTAADWELAWQLAERCRSRRVLLTGIAMAEWLAGQSPLLPEMKFDERYWPSAALLARLCKRLMHTPERKHRLVSCLGLNKTYMSLCDSPRDRLTYIFRMFTYPQPRDFIRLGLSPALLPVWGFMRPFVITGHCMKRAVGALVSGRTWPFARQ